MHSRIVFFRSQNLGKMQKAAMAMYNGQSQMSAMKVASMGARSQWAPRACFHTVNQTQSNMASLTSFNQRTFAQDPKEKIREAAVEGKEKAEKEAKIAKEKAEKNAEVGKEKAKAAAETVKEKAQKAKEKAKEAIRGTGEGPSVTEAVKEGVKKDKDYIKEKAKEVYEKAKDTIGGGKK